MGYDGFDGVDGGFVGVDGGFDGFDGFNGDDGGSDGVDGCSDGFVGLGGTNDVDGSWPQTWVYGGSRSTRRVGVVNMKKELMGSLIWFVVMTQSEERADGLSDMDWLMASMDGVDGWRRWMASIVDGGLGSSTQRALTWKSLCVPSGVDDTHSSSLLFV